MHGESAGQRGRSRQREFLMMFFFFLLVRSPQTGKGDIRRRERTCRDIWKDRRTSLWVIYILSSLLVDS